MESTFGLVLASVILAGVMYFDNKYFRKSSADK